ncbi:hypothetical protein F5B21DRAFT_70324 [Xylaria acuta]|nr:hypothetical protein F5B21DRAFT_70324 [Xylaria acuta]
MFSAFFGSGPVPLTISALCFFRLVRQASLSSTCFLSFSLPDSYPDDVPPVLSAPFEVGITGWWPVSTLLLGGMVASWCPGRFAVVDFPVIDSPNMTLFVAPLLIWAVGMSFQYVMTDECDL